MQQEQDQDQDGTAVPSWSCSQAVSKPVWHVPLLYVQWSTSVFGQRNCPKHVEFYSKNKFEKLVHLVGFITRKLQVAKDKRLVAGCCEYGNKPLGSMVGEVRKMLTNWASKMIVKSTELFGVSIWFGLLGLKICFYFWIIFKSQLCRSAI